MIRNGTFNGEYQVKRLILVCDFYKWGEREAVSGPDACNLQIGRLMVGNAYDYYKGKSKDFLDITEMGSNWIAFTEGVGADQVSQHFKIVRQELLANPPSK